MTKVSSNKRMAVFSDTINTGPIYKKIVIERLLKFHKGLPVIVYYRIESEVCLYLDGSNVLLYTLMNTHSHYPDYSIKLFHSSDYQSALKYILKE